ncbi:MAG: MFS transporter [Thermodesulfobacteriota bacterium]
MFRAFRSRNFALLWTGSFAANVGIWMQSVAMGWLIYDLTSSASWLGRVGFASSAPTLLLGLLGGAIIEHADRKRILCGSSLLFAACAFVLAVLTITGVVRIWMIIVISLVSGLGTAFFMPVFQALIPTLVPPEQLMNAISLNSISFNVARVVGPLIGGAVMTYAGVGWCFALNGVGFLIMLASALALDMPHRKLVAPARIGSALRAGLDYARRHPLIRALLVLCVTMSLFGFPYVVLMPALARDVLHLDADGFTLLFSAVGAGAVLGGLSLAYAGDVQHKGLLVVGCSCAFGLLLVLLANVRSFAAALAVLGAAGYAMIVCIASLNTLIQVTVADEMRARVMSMMTVSLFGLPTLGAWILGAIGDRIGITRALSLGGGVVAVMAIAVALMSPEMTRRQPR